MRLVEYIDGDGRNPFGKWFDRLDSIAAARVSICLARMESGNFSNSKGVGHGVLEYKLDYGPGYRIYFGFDGIELIILLAGGSKSRQQNDISEAQKRWRDYKQRKK